MKFKMLLYCLRKRFAPEPVAVTDERDVEAVANDLAEKIGSVSLSKIAAVCAARHYVAAHESCCTNTPVDLGAVCEGCPEAGINCRFDWIELMAPLFDATGVHPHLFRSSVELPADMEGKE